MAKKPVKQVVDELEGIHQAVVNAEAVAGFLRNLADQTATDPGVHSEIVKSATLLRIFLENQAKAGRERYPIAFEVKEKEDAKV